MIDAFQSMTVGRPYKERRTVERAVQELFEYAGAQFDRDVVEAFIAVLKEDGKISTRDERDYRRRLNAAPVGAPQA